MLAYRSALFGRLVVVLRSRENLRLRDGTLVSGPAELSLPPPAIGLIHERTCHSSDSDFWRAWP